MSRRSRSLCSRARLALALLAAAWFALPAVVVRTQPAGLPPWTRGYFEIHQISTGAGNAALLIFPDGTTLLVDAGSTGRDGVVLLGTEPRPNASRTTAAWIADYIEHALAPVPPPRLDYALVTHYHIDHIGALPELARRVPIATLIDRGAAYLPPTRGDTTWSSYVLFVDEAKRTRGLKSETIRVGRADQIVLVRDRAAYPTFEVRGVAANGDVWTGKGNEVAHVFPKLDAIRPEDRPSENMCSIALRIRYGPFDFYTGGDLPGVPDAGAPAWQSVETPIAKAIGPTDVHVVNHHGSIDPESPFFLSTLRSPVMILPAWSPTHPSQDVLKRMLATRLYPGPHDIFATLVREPTKASIGSRVGDLKASHGHIVVRVEPGGGSYRVFVLDDTTETRGVLSAHGPYQSK